MACCLSGKSPTPLEIYARSLPKDAEATPMFFPMYTVATDVLLKMTRADGRLVLFSDDMGRAVFVSHQWLAKRHPDPDFKQMRTLQDALRRLLSSHGFVSLDVVTESLVSAASPFPMQELQEEALFFWYDFFSCPQLEPTYSAEQDGGQANAIKSIPAYIARCHFFFALCPVLDCPFEGKVLSAAGWSRRGWCRAERAARELSPSSSWILIQSDTCMEVVGTAGSFPSGSVGEGDFEIAEDRQKLAPVMKQMLVQKLNHCLRVGDLPGFRRHFNLQAVHLRGLDIEPVSGLLPCGPQCRVAEFLYQNGLRRVGEADSAGWRPLHYAALAGDTEVLRGLLERRSDVNWRTFKEEPTLGIPPLTSVLDIASFYKHHEATRVLLEARAELERGFTASAVQCAAMSDNARSIRLLCEAGARPLARNLFGLTALQIAASYAATSALEELLVHGHPGPRELSLTLWASTGFRGGSAELVQRLLSRRADVDFQFDMRRDYRSMGRLLFAAKSLQYRLRKASVLTALAYHAHGSTPLMQAIRSAQYEAAAALIAAGARLDLRNCRHWTAGDFAEGQSIPDFLQLGLEGDASQCRRVCSLALPDGYVQVVL